MKKQLLIRLAGSTILAAMIGIGASQASSNSINTTGPDSNNQIFVSGRSQTNISNQNNININNSNHQTASTGDAIVAHNTWGGSATSGDASNSNQVSTAVSVSNPSFVAAPSFSDGNNSIENTGPDSNNQIVVKHNQNVNISNHTNVDVNNSNWQSAKSGSAVVADNTFGGNATSGDASNRNDVSTDVNVANAHPSSHWDNATAPMVWSNGQGNGWNKSGGSDFKLVDHRSPVQPCQPIRVIVAPKHQPCEVVHHPVIRPPCEVKPCRPVVRPCPPVVKPCPPRPCHPVVKPPVIKCHPVVCHPVVRCHPVTCQRIVNQCQQFSGCHHSSCAW